MRYVNYYKKTVFATCKNVKYQKYQKQKNLETAREIEIETLEKIELAKERLQKLDTDRAKLENREYLDKRYDKKKIRTRNNNKNKSRQTRETKAIYN